LPWRHGVVVILQASRTEDPRFEYPLGYKLKGIYITILLLKWPNLLWYRIT
jgi:hypothetical protein